MPSVGRPVPRDRQFKVNAGGARPTHTAFDLCTLTSRRSQSADWRIGTRATTPPRAVSKPHACLHARLPPADWGAAHAPIRQTTQGQEGGHETNR